MTDPAQAREQLLYCWDCLYFKSQGLSCPTHATPEERTETSAEVARRLADWTQRGRARE